MSAPAATLEILTRVTPLAIRFWDEADGRVVSDGLIVEVYPRDEPERRVAARPNRIGIFVVARLPGRRDPAFEFGAGDAAFWRGLVQRPHIIEVTDRDGHFQPFTLEQPLPAKGLVVPACLPPQSPPIEAVPLFSSPSRPVPTGMAVLRTELRTTGPMVAGHATSAPASWAVVDVHVAGQPPVRGVADREGRVAVVFPYPEPIASPARPSSPPFAAGQSLWDQEWPVRLDAFYDPSTPASDTPDLCRTLNQPPALLWAGSSGARPLPDQMLRYGQELVVRDLFLTAAGSPP